MELTSRQLLCCTEGSNPLFPPSCSTNHKRNTMDGVRDWLDSLKAGFGARFSAAFEEIGVEDISDLTDMDDELQTMLEAELRKAGAKAMQLKKIRTALGAIYERVAAADPLGCCASEPQPPGQSGSAVAAAAANAATDALPATPEMALELQGSDSTRQALRARSFWDASYQANSNHTEWITAPSAEVLKFLPSTATRVLEIGCGDSLLGEAIYDHLIAAQDAASATAAAAAGDGEKNNTKKKKKKAISVVCTDISPS